MKWLSLVVQERPALAKFNTLTHEQRVREFKQLDERVLLENQAALVSTLRDRVQHRLQQKEISESLPYLRKRNREATKACASSQNNEVGRGGHSCHQAVLYDEPPHRRTISRRIHAFIRPRDF